MLMKQQAQTVLHLLETSTFDLDYRLGGETLEEICWEGVDITFGNYHLYTNFAIYSEEDRVEEFYFGKAVIRNKPVGKVYDIPLGFVTNSRLISALRNNTLHSLLEHLEQPQHFWSEDEEFDPLAYKWMEIYEELFSDNSEVFYQYDGMINLYLDKLKTRYIVTDTNEEDEKVIPYVVKQEGVTGRHCYSAKKYTYLTTEEYLEILEGL